MRIFSAKSAPSALLGVMISLLSFTNPLIAETGCGYSQYDYNNDASGSGIFLATPCHLVEVDCRVTFLKVCGGGLSYSAEADPLPLPTPNWKIHDIKGDYHAGWDLGIAGISYDRHLQVKLNWEHFHAKDRASTKLSSSDMIGPFFEIGPDASPYNSAKGKVHYQFDEVNLDGGLLVNFGDYLRTNVYAGIGAARIKQTLTAGFSNPDGSITRTITNPSRFYGAGPQIGMDFSYDLCAGLSFTGNAAASLLVGTVKNHTSFKSYSPALKRLGIVPPNAQSTNTRHRTQLVPAFEGRLGMSYLFTLCDCLISLEAGYEAKIYIGAIQTTDISSEVVTPPVIPDTVGVYARTFHRNISNFALSGPYVRVNVAF